ncbi:phage baseplate assembly protein V [Paracoccus sp. MBLB3053]|uniref:Phage baseplate assembly protein V n=1 Tax=Paracoccus aurantius TaxID=3073814 RepID=A0ABU2I011_9RHOB|nr:phage baseplate assembly protein V [Paracoccus sp. MBLB3053]MDS9470130.1 phage baseplate assembly protein V [Paracoccus sp. MBLB3053]
MNRPLVGLYRATVTQNADPNQTGHIQVEIPGITAFSPSTWVKPCLPVAGLQQGLFSVPMVGSGVWIQFEQGDADKPVWLGCFLGTVADKPLLANTAPPPTPAVTIQTPLKNGIVISDGLGPSGVGGITIQSASGATITVNDTGIVIMNGRGAVISLVGNAVDINLGALIIT